LGISDRGTKAKTITSCDNACVTNNLLLPLRCTTLSRKKHLAAAATLHYAFAQKTFVGPRLWSASEAAHRTPPGKRPVGMEINHTL